MGCGAQSSASQTQDNIIVPQAVRRFLRKQLIGRGSYGEVYRCLDTLGDGVYAMKVIKINAKTREQVSRQINELKSEISVLKKLNHPNIVKYESFDVTPDLQEVEIVMELAKGGTLKEYVEKNGPLSEAMSAEMGAKILKALVYIHSQNVIHRDLKCANVLLTENLEPKLSDFGTAKVIYKKDKDDIAKMSASLKGTPFYMAPEVIKRTGHDHSADIWSFGCMMVEMLSGKVPWSTTGLKFSEVISKISSGLHPPLPASISKQCNYFLESCLDPLPSQRLKAQELLKHRFIDKSVIKNLASNKKQLQKNNSNTKKARVASPVQKSEDRGSQQNGVRQQNRIQIEDVQIENLEEIEPHRIFSDKKKGNLKVKTRQYDSETQTSRSRQDHAAKPVKKQTQKYLNQLNNLDLIEAQMKQVSVDEEQPSSDKYYIKKTLANLKKSKNGKNISRTAAHVKNAQQNLAQMSASQNLSYMDSQMRSYTDYSKEEQAINTMISKAERDQYLEQQKILQKQKDEQKRKWEQELKEGAQMLKKQFSYRYMYRGA